jgi:hypothetical protein
MNISLGRLSEMICALAADVTETIPEPSIEQLTQLARHDIGPYINSGIVAICMENSTLFERVGASNEGIHYRRNSTLS